MATEGQSWQANLVNTAEDKMETKVGKESLETSFSESDAVEQSISNDFRSFIKILFSNNLSKESSTADIHVDKGVNLSEILARLTSLISSPKTRVLPPDTYNHISILSQHLQGYLQLLETEQLESLSQRISTDTTKWLTGIFGLDNTFSSYHQKKLDGLLKVCKLALHSKYSKYATDGFTALYTRPPVVYINSAAPPEFGKQLRNELGLPQSSICTVPCNTMFGSPYTMDVAAFERLLTDDVSCGKTPLILIAYAGTPLSGHTDNLSRLREICTQSGVWFHVEGDTLANLALPHVPPSVQVATTADSLTLNVSKWFSMPALPYCTFYRTNNLAMAHSAGLTSSIHDNLNVLPLWVIIQFMGTHDLRKIIEHASGLSQQMCHRLDMINGIKRIEQPSGVSPVVIFKYKASPSLPLAYGSNTDDDSKVKKPLVATRGKVDVSPRLSDTFNKYLTTYLQQTAKKLTIDSVTIPREKTCIRFQPLQTSRSSETSKVDVDEFAELIQNKIIELDYTLIHRSAFEETFQRIPDVVLIDVGDDAVIGAFQCIPKYWKTKNMSNLSDMKKHEANELNVEIYDGLASHYKCVEQRMLSNGQICVQVGVVDKHFNLQQFADVVLRYTIEMEDNAKFVESLSDSVQKSIEEAQTKLEKEREERFFQDDVLRNVPLVSSFYNWWSPPPKDSHGVIGRSFDLSSGKLEATDKTYKLKMQIHDDQSDRFSQLSQKSNASSLHVAVETEPPFNKSLDDDNNDEISETLSEVDSAVDELSENKISADETEVPAEKNKVPVDENKDSSENTIDEKDVKESNV